MMLIQGLMAQEPTDSLDTEDDPGEIVKPEINPDSKFGIKMGTGITSMVGSSNYHPTAAFYLSGGVYYRKNLGKHWILQPEILMTYKGSNFNNGTNELRSIKVYCIEAPVMIFRGINENNSTAWGAGIQYSHNLNSLAYITGKSIPEDAKPKLLNDDIQIVGGGRFQTPFVGFTCLVKYGLLDVNKGILSGVGPAIDGKPMHHLTFELSILF